MHQGGAGISILNMMARDDYFINFFVSGNILKQEQNKNYQIVKEAVVVKSYPKKQFHTEYNKHHGL